MAVAVGERGHVTVTGDLKKNNYTIFLCYYFFVSVLISAHVERFNVSRMSDLIITNWHTYFYFEPLNPFNEAFHNENILFDLTF